MTDIAVLNNSGAAILQGQVVRQTGFVQPQQVPSIALASAASSSTATVLGIATQVIANNAIGQVRVSGSYGPLDTSLFIVNAKVYLSDTPGEISPVPGTVESAIGNAETSAVSGCVFITCTTSTSCPTTGSGTQGVTGLQGATGVGSGGGGGSTGLQGPTGIQGLTGIAGGGTGIQGVTGLGGGGTGASNTLNMNALGNLAFAGPLPRVNIGPELVGGVTTFVDFRARRGVPGSSGTTTIQLELNGTPIVGATLSWTPADAAFSLKTVVISVAVVAGDRLSFRLNSREGGSPQDIYAEVNA